MEALLAFITTPTYLFFIALELYLSHREHRQLYNFKESLNSLLLGAGGLVFDVAMKSVAFFVLDGLARRSLLWDFWQQHRAAAWVTVFFAQDFCFYWLHRAEHYCRVLWAVHSNHHSAEHFNFTVALRSSMMQPLYRYLFFAPAALLGFDGTHVLFIYALNQTYQFFLHTETVRTLGFLEKILVTPSHHRVHHASNVAYLDKNMGQVLIVWDKLFGTFAPETATEATRYGLKKPLDTQQFSEVAFREWRVLWHDLRQPGLTVRDRFNYVFAPPGWSHDGRSQTATQLRAESPEPTGERYKR